jgi:Fe-S cluster assembly scaffold protein SufB
MKSAVSVRSEVMSKKDQKEDFRFWQVDHQVKRSEGTDGVVVLPSPSAYRQFPWARKYFGKKPSEGYFVWVRESVGFPLSTCVTIASPKVSQRLNNLLVVEAGVKAEAGVVCNAAKPDLGGVHQARGKMVLKERAQLVYRHFHRWGHEDLVSPDYRFILGKNARLTYSYQNLLAPKELNLKTLMAVDEGASCNLEIIVDARFGTEVAIADVVRLNGNNARGVVRLRLVGRERAKIKAVSRMLANGAGEGHLDCQGLLMGDAAEISLVPEVVCRHKEAQITHEASIGKVSEEALNYLRSRGLTEDEAIDLIVAGFLEEH